MKKEGIRYQKKDNAFTHISDFERANELAQSLDPAKLEAKFNQYASGQSHFGFCSGFCAVGMK